MTGRVDGPTLDQLARFVCVQALGPGFTTADFQLVAAQLAGNPGLEAAWRERHAEFQRALSGARAALSPAPEEGEA